MSDRTQKALFRALYRMLRPMVRLLMRHGVSYRLFADIARHVYVDTAKADFSLPGRKPSLARMAVLTGINRKDIAKLQARPHPLSDTPEERPTPAARVITGWLNDARFRSGADEPAELFVEEHPGQPSFSCLVREYSSDVPARALLDELERIRAVRRNGDRVVLVAHGYVPVEDMEENIRIFGTAASDLMSTMDHNIAAHSGETSLDVLKTGSAAGTPLETFIQRTVAYQNIPEELLESIRQRSASEGQQFLLQVNDWLADYDKGEPVAPMDPGRARAGIGLYYFEEKFEEKGFYEPKGFSEQEGVEPPGFEPNAADDAAEGE